MKRKKVISLVLVMVMLASMLTMTGCSNEEKQTGKAEEKEEVKDNSYSSSVDWDMDREYYYQNCSTIKDDVDSNGNEVVFESVIWEELLYLCQQEGNYMIFFGGVEQENSAEVMGTINELANQYGIKTVYNFDFWIDGSSEDTDIAVSTDAQTTGALYNQMYGYLVEQYLTNLNDFVEYTADSENAVTYNKSEGMDKETFSTILGEDIKVPKVQTPFVFIYNKDNKADDGSAKPIVCGYEKNSKSTDEYKEAVEKEVFANVKSENMKFGEFSDEDYIRLAYNEENIPGIENLELRMGTPIFPENQQVNVKDLTYAQLTWLLQQKGDYLIFFGAPWCGNTQAAIATVNDYAVENDLVVYNLDLSLDSWLSVTLLGYGYDRLPVIKYNAFPLTHLYTDLVSNYLTNIELEIDGSGERYIEYTDKAGKSQKMGEMQTPFFLAYNKDAVDEDDFATPIIGSVEDSHYSLGVDRDDYIYKADNYKKYRDEVYNVYKAYADDRNMDIKDIEVDRSAK